MENEAYAYGLSDVTSSRNALLKSQSHFYCDYVEVDEDDVFNSEYPCPFCSEDFDLVELCCHIDDEHPLEAESAICPVCSTRVDGDMVGHITMQHGDIINSQHRLKFRKDDLPQTLSFERKWFEDDHAISLHSGFSSKLSTSKMALDPLLSFLCTPPVVVKPISVQPVPTNKGNLEDKNLDDRLSERDGRLCSIPEAETEAEAESETNLEEKTRKCEFVRELVFSTFF